MSERKLICGVDEAGRGPLAGPVVAAAVILPSFLPEPLRAVRDSKMLSARQRQQLRQSIESHAVDWAVASVSASDIDRLNIRQATLLAMQQAVSGLTVRPDQVRVDGRDCPVFTMSGKAVPALAIVRGDQSETCISAASILAKVTRDHLMLQWHARYPQYGFDRHKGYPTAAHLHALRKHGACSAHRCSFSPVVKLMTG